MIYQGNCHCEHIAFKVERDLRAVERMQLLPLQQTRGVTLVCTALPSTLHYARK